MISIKYEKKFPNWQGKSQATAVYPVTNAGQLLVICQFLSKVVHVPRVRGGRRPGGWMGDEAWAIAMHIDSAGSGKPHLLAGKSTVFGRLFCPDKSSGCFPDWIVFRYCTIWDLGSDACWALQGRWVAPKTADRKNFYDTKVESCTSWHRSCSRERDATGAFRRPAMSHSR
jgi:hypothetical protein